MSRLTLQQRRDVRYEALFIATMAAKGTTQTTIDSYVENLIDRIDYQMEPPRWHARLAERRAEHC